jgi:phosphate-selective porin
MEVQVGQFKVPLGLEGQSSSAALGTVERSLFATDRARGAYYADIREFGVLAKGTVKSAGLDYQVGLYNGLVGATQNDLDKDDGKALAGRLVWRPAFLPGVQLGVSGAADKEMPSNTERRRLGLEWQWTAGPWTWRAELMSGRDGIVDRRGYYAHAGYRIAPRIDLIARFDTWDPDTDLDTSAATVLERDYVAGVNCYLANHNVKAQLEYIRKTFARDVVAARNVVLMNMQLSW